MSRWHIDLLKGGIVSKGTLFVRCCLHVLFGAAQSIRVLCIFFLSFSPIWCQGPCGWVIYKVRCNCSLGKILFRLSEDLISRFCPCCLELPRTFWVSYWHRPQWRKWSSLIFFPSALSMPADKSYFYTDEFNFVCIEMKSNFQARFIGAVYPLTDQLWCLNYQHTQHLLIWLLDGISLCLFRVKPGS